MVQLTLQTTAVKEEDVVKVPVFIYEEEQEAKQLANLIVKVKPTYLLNCSNSVESLRNYVNSGKVTNSICYVLDSRAVATIEDELLTKLRVIDLFN